MHLGHGEETPLSITFNSSIIPSSQKYFHALQSKVGSSTKLIPLLWERIKISEVIVLLSVVLDTADRGYIFMPVFHEM